MSKPAAKPPKDFEEAMTELEQIVADLEAGRATLEESLQKFERGTFLIEHCRKVLSAAERRIEQLSTPKAPEPVGGPEPAAEATDAGG